MLDAHRLLLLCAFLLLGGGCAAIPLTTVGTVLGAAAPAVAESTAVYSLGKLDFAVNADLVQCYSAVEEGIADLQLHIKQSKFTNEHRYAVVWKVEDDRKSKIDITVDQRTPKLCQCGVNVGIFGSEPTAKLIMEKIRRHLPKVDIGAEGVR